MQKYKIIKLPKIILFTLVLCFASSPLVSIPASADVGTVRPIIFPIIGPGKFSNDYYAPRSAPWNIHEATDIMATKGQQIVSPVDGVITFVAYPQPSYGYTVNIRDNDGYSYNNLHINDDNPNTNDGKGGAMSAYAPDIKEGNPVVRGQLLGWVGDSGHSNGVSHLHFEMEAPDGSRINPYFSLVPAQRVSQPSNYPQLPNEGLPYGTNFKGGISIAMGNYDLDAGTEFITGAGSGGGPHVRIFNDDGAAKGGDFMAYNPAFVGGIDVASGDIDGDGTAEIITGPGAGGGPNVKVFKADGTLISSFNAYNSAFTGGIDVASANVTGTIESEIITAPGRGGGPNVKVFESDSTVISSFFAYSEEFRGGVRVSAGNVKLSTADAEILTVPASPPGGPHIRMLTYDGTTIKEANFMERWWEGFHDVGAGDGASLATTGTNRRSSVRAGLY